MTRDFEWLVSNAMETITQPTNLVKGFAMSCGDINFLEGGALKDCHLIGGSASGMSLNDCELCAPRIRDIACLDTSSTLTIANSIAALPCEHLTALAKALSTTLKHYICKECCCTPPQPIVKIAGCDCTDDSDCSCSCGEESEEEESND